MRLNQALTIIIVYQTHNNNNYPKHNTITININKVNKINTLTAPPQELLHKNTFSPFLTRMAKGSVVIMCGDAVKFC